MRLAVLGILASLISQPAAARIAAAEIRALRGQSNEAIAAHDLAGMKAILAPDYHVLPGSIGLPLDLATFDARLGSTFADPTFAGYVRRPIRIRIARSGKRAAESGRWVGTWRRSDGTMRVSGTYLATWVPSEAGWQLRNEVFVTLDCRGSASCADAG